MAEINVRATIWLGVVGMPEANLIGGSETPLVEWNKPADFVCLKFHPKEMGEPRIIADILACFGVKAGVHGRRLELVKTGSWGVYDGMRFHIFIPVPLGALPPKKGLCLVIPGEEAGWKLGVSPEDIPNPTSVIR